jgi:hypothetical protein
MVQANSLTSIERLRRWWPGWRWAIVFMLGGVLVFGTAAAIAGGIAEDRANHNLRVYHYCLSIQQEPVVIDGKVTCNMAAAWEAK